MGCSKKKKDIRFGMVTDLHYAKIDARPGKTRYYRDSVTKLRNAIKEFNAQDLDFIIELGDLKDQALNADKAETLNYLKAIENEFQQFKGPVYHVLGNHDMDCISKSEFLANITNTGQAETKAYYSFQMKGLKFIVLDANYLEDGSHYDSGNFEWFDSNIPESQLKWLNEELVNANQPCVIFVHQQIDSFHRHNDPHCVKNAKAVRDILEANENVLAVFQGHNHCGGYQHHNGIHYYTLKAMVEGPAPESSYAIAHISSEKNLYFKAYLHHA